MRSHAGAWERAASGERAASVERAASGERVAISVFQSDFPVAGPPAEPRTGFDCQAASRPGSSRGPSEVARGTELERPGGTAASFPRSGVGTSEGRSRVPCRAGASTAAVFETVLLSFLHRDEKCEGERVRMTGRRSVRDALEGRAEEYPPPPRCRKGVNSPYLPACPSRHGRVRADISAKVRTCTGRIASSLASETDGTV